MANIPNFTNLTGGVFPSGLSDNTKQSIDKYVDSLGLLSFNKQLKTEELQQAALKRKKQNEYTKGRSDAKLDLTERSMDAKSPEEAGQYKATGRFADLADMVRNYMSQGGMDLTSMSDQDVVKTFLNDNKQMAGAFATYMNGDMSAYQFANQYGFVAPQRDRTEGENRSIGGQIANQEGGEWNDNLIGRFETAEYDEEKGWDWGEFGNNTWKSLLNVGSDYGNMGLNLFDTANSLLKTAVGGTMNLFSLDNLLDPYGEGWLNSANETADMVGDVLADRYGWGGAEEGKKLEQWGKNLRNTAYSDPFGAISDVAGLFEGGASIVKGATKGAAKGAAKAGLRNVASNLDNVSQIAGKVSDVAHYGDPFNRYSDGTKAAAKGLYNSKAGQPVRNAVQTVKNTVSDARQVATTKLNNVIDGIYGLDSKTKKAIQDNPYSSAVWRDVENYINENGLPERSQEVAKKMIGDVAKGVEQELTKYIEANKDTGRLYGPLRNSMETVDFTSIKTAVKDAMSEQGVQFTKNGGLDFSKSAISPTEASAIRRLYKWIDGTESMPMKEYLTFRRTIDQFGLWDDAKGTPGKALLEQIRGIANDEAHTQSALLKQLDGVFSEQKELIKQATEGLVYRDKRRFGQWRDNINQIMKNMDTPNRKQMKDRLEKLVPGVEKRVEAINSMPKLIDNYYRPGKADKMIAGVGTMAGASIGGIGGAAIGAGVGYGLSKLYGYLKGKAWNKAISTMSEEGLKNLKDIERKIANNEMISRAQKNILDKLSDKLRASGNEKEALRTDVISALSLIDDPQDLLQGLNEGIAELKKVGDTEGVKLLEETKKNIEDQIREVEEEKLGREAMEKDFAKSSYNDSFSREMKKKIHQVQEQEQRIGKVGNKKVKDPEYMEKQRLEWLKKKESLITQIQEQYNLDQFEAANLYDEWENAGADNYYKYQTADGGDKNLLALHNLSLDNLKKSRELGGFPMPSIAVTKSGVPHTSYGDISIIFKGDTIDPKMNKSNKLYSSDAYTPTVPNITSQVKGTVEADRIMSEIGKKTGLSYGEIHQWAEYPDDYERYYPQLKEFRDDLSKIVEYKIFDGYTNSGKRRYLDYNLENIVKYMKKSDKNAGAFGGQFGKLVGQERGKLKSIEDVRKQNYSLTDTDAYGKYANQYNDAKRDVFRNITNEDSFLDFDVFNDIVESSYDKNDSKRLSKINHELEGDFGYKVSLDDVKKMHEPIIEGARIDRPYAEAKPERAVGFNEIGAIVVPEEQLVEAQNLLKGTGIEAVPYKKGERMNVVEQVANEKDLKFQQVGQAGANEKIISAQEGLKMGNFKNNKTVKELATGIGIKTEIAKYIATPEGQRAFGAYGDGLLRLAEQVAESTAPHELLHGAFDVVDARSRADILDFIGKQEGYDAAKAEEWMADRFSEYFRTGELNLGGIKFSGGMKERIKQFFYKVKEFLNGTYANRKQIENLFNDIVDGKVQGDFGAYSSEMFQTVWQGSPNYFTKHSNDYMGSGEGNQVHGWGQYVAVDRSTGEHYATELQNGIRFTLDGEPIYTDNGSLNKAFYNLSDTEREIFNKYKVRQINDYSFSEAWDSVIEDIKGIEQTADKEIDEANSFIDYLKRKHPDEENTPRFIEEEKDRIRKAEESKKTIPEKIKIAESLKNRIGNNRHLYKIDIPDPVKKNTPTGSNYLEEDGLLTKSQYMEIFDDMKKKGLLKGNNASHLDYYIDYGTAGNGTEMPGYNLYNILEQILGTDEAASKYLESLGYDGIHYFGERDGECYVIFNTNNMEILEHEQL